MKKTDKCDHIVIKNNPKAISPNFYSVLIFVTSKFLYVFKFFE